LEILKVAISPAADEEKYTSDTEGTLSRPRNRKRAASSIEIHTKRRAATEAHDQHTENDSVAPSGLACRIACTQQEFVFRAPFIVPESETNSVPFRNFPMGIYSHDMDSEVIVVDVRKLLRKLPPDHVSLLATRLFRAMLIRVVVSSSFGSVLTKPPSMKEWLTNWPVVCAADAATGFWESSIQDAWKSMVRYILDNKCLGQLEVNMQTRVLAMVALRLGPTVITTTDVTSLEPWAGPRTTSPPTTLLDQWHKTIPRRLLLIAIPAIRSSLMSLATGQSTTLLFDVEAHVWGWSSNTSVEQMAANTMLGLLVCGELTICQPVALECHQGSNKGALPDPLGVWVPVQSNKTQANIFGVMGRLTELHTSVLVQATEAVPIPIRMQIPKKNSSGPNQTMRAHKILNGLRRPTDDDDFYLTKVIQTEAHGDSCGAATGGCIISATHCSWGYCYCFLQAGLIGSLIVSGLDQQPDSCVRFTTLLISDQYKIKTVWSPILRKLVEQNPHFSFCICTAHIDRKGYIKWEKTSFPTTTDGPNQYHSLYIMELPVITKAIIRKLNISLQLGDNSPVPITVDRLVWDTVCAHHKAPDVFKGSDCIDVFESWQNPISSRIQWLILPSSSVAYCMTRGRESKLRLLSSIGLDADSRRVFDTLPHVVFNLTDTFIQAPLKRERVYVPLFDNLKEAGLHDTQQNTHHKIREQLEVGSVCFRSSSRYQFIQTANATLNKLQCTQSLFSHEMSDIDIFDGAILLLTDPSHRRLLYTKTGKIGGAKHTNRVLQLAAGVDIMRIPGANSILTELQKIGTSFLYTQLSWVRVLRN
jgi:hypothetical protein